eukprot:m.7799 g.7799  ORF g.7799 m.7799 type:complete len:906 (+) comp3776_c0_seq1:146-2863(+)
MAADTGAMLEVLCKTAQPTDFKEPFASYIANELGQDPGDFSGGVTTMTDLRKTVCVKRAESYEGSITALSKYYGLLLSASKRFPMAEGGRANLNFTWNEIYEQQGLFGKGKKSSCAVDFEKACVLFNLGAVHSQIGRGANLKTDEGQKSAIDNFQKAAAYFRRLKEFMEGSFGGRSPSADLEPGLLDAMSKTMLAQAQEALVSKGVAARMKNTLVAKLSMSAHSMFAEALSAAESRKELRQWIPLLKCKETYFLSVAQYRMSAAAGDTDNYGEQLSRLREAVTLGQKAAQLAAGTSMAPIAKIHNDKIRGGLETAEKDNKLIYNAMVPALSSLPAIVGQAVASSERPLPDFETDAIRGPDPFEKLLPFEVATGVSDYKIKQDTRTADIIDKLRQATRDTVSALGDMNLPAAIQVTEDPGTLPEALLNQGREIVDRGGPEELERLINSLESPRSKIREILEEAERLLSEEEAQDNEMRSKHGSRWTRTPSKDLTAQTRDEGQKMRSWLEKAADGDAKVKAKFEENKSGIVVLCKPAHELNEIIPKVSGTPMRTPSGRDSTGIEELKKLLTQLDQLRLERDSLEAEVQSTKDQDNIQDLLLQHTDGSVDQASLFAQQLSRYDDVEKRATDIVTKSMEVLTATQQANTVFVSGRDGAGGNQREGMIADLGLRYEAAVDLFNNLDEGTKFYGKLTTMCMKYKNKVTDFHEARRIEKQETLADLNKAIASTPSEQYATHNPAPPGRNFSSSSTGSMSNQGQIPQQNQIQPQSQMPPQSQPQQQQYQPAPAYPGPPHGAPPSNMYNQPQQPQYQNTPQYGQQTYTPQYSGYQQPAQPAQYAPQYGAPSQQHQGGIPSVVYGQQPQQQPQYQQYPAMNMPAPANNEWACIACSFFNSDLLPKCEMCDTPRPR